MGKWDEAAEIMSLGQGGNPGGPTGTPEQSVALEEGKASPSKWDDALRAIKTDSELAANPGFTGHLGSLLKFTGHGIPRGLAETLGMPVDAINTVDEFLRFQARPEAMNTPGKVPTMPDPLYYGSGKSIRKGFENVGIPTSSSREEGVSGSAAYLGDKLGEFAGANIPFIGAAPARIATKTGLQWATNAERIARSGKPVSETLKDFTFGGVGPGLGAGLGGEIASKDNEGAGELAGALVGGARPVAAEGMFKAGGVAKSWLHDFLGFGTGAQQKVGKGLVEVMQDPQTALSNIQRKIRQRPAPANAKRKSSLWDLSPGAEIPVDIKSADDGLIALRRTVMAKDAELTGDYRRMQQATAEAIKEDAKYAKANFNDPLTWLGLKQKSLESLSNQRLQLAEQEAQQLTDAAFRGVEPNQIDANVAKHAYAINLRKQLLSAQDDLNSVVQSKWEKVDKTLPSDMSSVYDELRTMRAEHKGRPGQSDKRFPSEFVDRFFTKQKSANGQTVEVPKFGAATTLQDVIDLDSEVQQAVREESAADAPDRVKMSYLTRLSKALYGVKEQLPGAGGQNLELKDALSATKMYHDTFTRGPVGEVLGHDVPGSPDVLPGDTIKHFLSQGPSGIDNFDSLMRAMQARTGQTAPIPPSAQMQEMVEKYVRQDFYDHAAPNGQFNRKSAERWMKNNAGPLGHFTNLRQEFENATASDGRLASAVKSNKQDLDDLRGNRVALFLGGDPGALFNGALRGPDKYGATRELVAMTKDDPTGRATEGLAQMAFDHMLANSVVVDRNTMDLERLNGAKIMEWVRDNKGVIRALDDELPGIAKRFDRIAETGKYLEGFQVAPAIPERDSSKMMLMRDIMARIMGANVFTRFGHGGGSIQTAAIGSQAFKQIAAQLTPDQARSVFKRAMVDPAFFEVITKDFAKQGPQEAFRVLHPYFYSMGIPLAQPILTQPPERKQDLSSITPRTTAKAPELGERSRTISGFDPKTLGAEQAPDGNYYLPDPDRPGGFMRVEN